MRAILHGIGSYVPGAVIGPVQWPHHDLIVVTEGRVVFTIGRKTLQIDAGDACLFPPEKKIRGVAGLEGATIWVQHFVSAESRSPSGPAILQQGQPLRLGGVARGEWARALMRRARQLQARRPTTVTRRISGLALSLLLEEFGAAAGQDQSEPGSVEARVLAATEWASQQRTPPPTIAQMADQAGWSVNYFREKFHEVTGRTVGMFLRGQTMAEAERLLRETNLPIKEISERIGYGDVIAFHHAFRQRFRTTPAKYRKSAPVVV